MRPKKPLMCWLERVADRESDIYEQFARRPSGVQLLTRAAQDRSLADVGRLFATIDAWPEQHREAIVLPAQPGRREREACVALRFGRVSLRRPTTADIQLAASVDLFVVDVTEVDPPPGVERLHWRLLTTHDVTTVDEAKEIVRWYRLRWTIDIDQAWRLSRIKGWVGSTCTEAFWVEHQSRPNPRGRSASDSWSTRSRHSSMASRRSASALSARLAGRLSRHS